MKEKFYSDRTIENHNDVLSLQKEEPNYIIATCYMGLRRELAFQLFYFHQN